MSRVVLAILLLAGAVAAQTPQPPEAPPPPPVEFVCPMDPDIRAKGPGRCSKCGMALEAGIPDLIEYPLAIRTSPAAPRPGQAVRIEIDVRHPKTGERVRNFQVVHEKLFHLFLISRDLEYFAHVHPEITPGGGFQLKTTLPQAGVYRLLSDFYPEGGTPQMIVKTLVVGGAPADGAASVPKLAADLQPKQAENLRVELHTEPPQPLAGKKTLLFFRLDPAEGFEPYLGAWGHLLAASDDLVDLAHAHPFLADGGPQVQFNVIFPREAVYRVWVQFQRQGRVNTVAFTVPVAKLR